MSANSSSAAPATGAKSAGNNGQRSNNNASNNNNTTNRNGRRNNRPGGGGGGGGGIANHRNGGQARGGAHAAAASEQTAAAAAAAVERRQAEQRRQDEEDEAEGETCVVCFKVVEIFSIGECDHAVCYECSTRMRVLCKQNECPICRTDMSKVMFTTEVLTFRQLEINNRTGLYDKKHRICFASLRCQESYNLLLESPCTICNQNCANFEALREHVKKKHERHYCDICTDNLSIFSFERRSYTRVDLGIHRRKGDADDTSHKGHPLCEYCDVRFFDRDELFKHLRREHFYCHFCDADGANCYYADYAALRVHFKSDHFLCEDGECAQEQFTAVFRTEIDLRAHIASLHSSGLSRQAARQNRTLDLEITLAPRGQNGGAAVSVSTGGSGGHRASHHRDTQHEFDTPSAHHHAAQGVLQQQPQRVIDARNENEFPTLGGGPSSSGLGAFTLSPLVRAYGGTRGIARTLDNFPTLGGGSVAPAPSSGTAYKKSASALLKSSGSAASATASSSVVNLASRSGAAKRPDVSRAQDFPSLGSGSASTTAAGPAKGKKSASLFLDDDFVPLMPSANYSGSLASKHRQLANNGYESALTGAADSKLGLVKQPTEVKKAVGPTHVPKISSAQNFPTLGNAPSAAMSAQWVTLGGGASKRPPVESKKSKVAPAPLSTQPQPTASRPIKQTTATVTAAVSKKPAASDARKPTSAAAASTKPPSTASATKSVGNSKPKQKNYNPFESDSDEEASKFHATSEVLSATSAKHRGMVDSYESVAKAGGTKLSLVQQRTEANKPVSPARAAPRLSSADNFPSLGGGGGGSSASNPSSMHFTSMMKSANGKKSPSENNNEGGQSNRNTVNQSARAPPPGFVPPPPGFKTRPATVGAIAVSPVDVGQAYEYRAPTNSARRNQTLFTHVQAIGEPVVVSNFKHMSQMFINGLYKPEPYYEDCRVVMASRFDEMFPEMLALLPDIAKQQELHFVHTQRLARGGAKPKKSNGSLEVCATCKQVLVPADLIGHVQSHALENNFPTLSTQQRGASASSAWTNASVLGTSAGSRSTRTRTKTKTRQAPAHQQQWPIVIAVAAIAICCWWFSAVSGW